MIYFLLAIEHAILFNVSKTIFERERQKTRYWKNKYKKTERALEDIDDRLRYLSLDEAEALFEELDIPKTAPFLGIVSPLCNDRTFDVSN